MLAVTFADLIFRARQFVIAIVGVGLVLGLALLLNGLAAGFRYEVVQTVDGVGASSWVLSSSAQGRVTAFAAFPEKEASVVGGQPGVRQASPLLFVPSQELHVGGTTFTVMLVGVVPGQLGDPAVDGGHRLAGADQVVVDTILGLRVGSNVVLGGHTFRVVGTVANRTLLGGTALIYLPLSSAQAVATGGQPLVTAVAVAGTPAHVPQGLAVLTPGAVINDTVGQLASAVSSIESTRWLMWTVAAMIVASMLYVAALERTRDFAVLKALGSSSAALFGSLVLEAVVVTLLATIVAELITNVLAPIFSQPIDLTIGARATLPLIAVVVGVVASVTALRRVTGADPAAAFG
jgi:putative ABC transport system permease protein